VSYNLTLALGGRCHETNTLTIIRAVYRYSRGLNQRLVQAARSRYPNVMALSDNSGNLTSSCLGNMVTLTQGHVISFCSP
jgi:hypothetical protein